MRCLASKKGGRESSVFKRLRLAGIPSGVSPKEGGTGRTTFYKFIPGACPEPDPGFEG